METASDTERLFVRVSSDTASVVSSQTLVEANEENESFEASAGVDGGSDPVSFAVDGDSVDDSRPLPLPEVRLRQPDSFDIEEVRGSAANVAFGIRHGAWRTQSLSVGPRGKDLVTYF